MELRKIRSTKTPIPPKTGHFFRKSHHSLFKRNRSDQACQKPSLAFKSSQKLYQYHFESPVLSITRKKQAQNNKKTLQRFSRPHLNNRKIQLKNKNYSSHHFKSLLPNFKIEVKTNFSINGRPLTPNKIFSKSQPRRPKSIQKVTRPTLIKTTASHSESPMISVKIYKLNQTQIRTLLSGKVASRLLSSLNISLIFRTLVF